MSLHSSYWYRVADIRPRLRTHVQIHRHVYRGSNWYVLQDKSSGRQHRFSDSAYRIIGLMDGKKTVQQIWDGINRTLGDDAPTQDELIRLLAQLHFADVLQSDFPPDTLELLERRQRQRKIWRGSIRNPLAMKFPLIDPDRILERWAFLTRPFFHYLTLFSWLLVVGSAAFLAALHWQELSENMVDRVLTPESMLILWLLYPGIKLLHELGHAFATKRWGGEVHEMGIMLLVFTPIPYVDSSASSFFDEKKKRMAVAASGMAIELFIAAIALFLWLSVESGRFSTVLYNIMLIGSVSTLLFNGNPLLRFDGYYILADWLEIPNLAQRSTRYLGYLCQKYLFGITEASSPVTADGERKWFIGYGVLSFFYRIFILTSLCLIIAGKYFLIGMNIAAWALFSQIVLPAVKGCYRLFTSFGGRRRRMRLVAVTTLFLTTAVLFFFILPVPYYTRTEGVISIPEHSQVRAGTDCFLAEIYSQDDTMINGGDPVARCEEPFLDAEAKVMQAELAEIKAKYASEPLQSRVTRDLLRKKIEVAQANLERTQERMDELLISSPNAGILVMPEVQKLKGSFVRQGQVLGYVLGNTEPTATVIVRQEDITLVREQTGNVRLWLAGNREPSLTAEVSRLTPAASDVLPSPVLGITGGGSIPVRPTDTRGVETFSKTFQLEIPIPLDADRVRLGERVYALFDHGYKPLAFQWYHSLRTLFLRRLNI